LIPPSFQFEALPARVRFGSGTIATIGEEAEHLSARRLLLLCTPQQEQQAKDIAATLGNRAVGVFAGAAMHTPIDVTEKALAFAQQVDADGLVSIGGGSAIGLGKAIALKTDLPQIAVPTTYAGSEATPILGQTEAGIKTTQRTLRVLPESIIYDVDLTMTLPVAMSMTSGLNSLAHAAEALYAPNGNPIIDLMAEQGIAALLHALPAIHAAPDDREARALALYGAWLSGSCLGSVGMGLHHKICHVLGGTFDLPHAETHAAMLAHSLAYNLPAATGARVRLQALLGSDDPAQALYTLSLRVGAPRALRDLGMPERGIEQAADLAVASPYPNPRPLDRGAIAAMLRRAWAGDMPVEDLVEADAGV
jgi:alcohol dehydrogenase class IV